MHDDTTRAAPRIRSGSWTSIAILPFLSIAGTAGAYAGSYPWEASWWALGLASALTVLALRGAVAAFRSLRAPVAAASFQAVLEHWVAGMLGGPGAAAIVSDDPGALRLCVCFCLLTSLVLLRGWIPVAVSD